MNKILLLFLAIVALSAAALFLVGPGDNGPTEALEVPPMPVERAAPADMVAAPAPEEAPAEQ
jgi:hypothetical protein